MARRKVSAGGLGDPDNAASALDPAARPWTPEEMRAAIPLPLPTTEGGSAPGPAGHPVFGEGETAPAGRPDPP